MDELEVDATLAHPARDQLRVLAAEVDDEHGAFVGLGLLGQGEEQPLPFSPPPGHARPLFSEARGPARSWALPA